MEGFGFRVWCGGSELGADGFFLSAVALSLARRSKACSHSSLHGLRV